MAGDQRARRALADAARARLVAALDGVLGDRLRTEPGVRPDYYSDGIVVGAFGLLERCGRRAAHPADDFAESVRTARRRIGLAALRRLGDDASAATHLASAVDEVVTDGNSLARGLTDWLEGLDRAGRAAVVAAAISWAEGVVRLVGTDPGIRWADASSAAHWNVPDRLVRVSGSHDALLGGVVRGERLLLVADGDAGPADRLRAGYLALVRSLGTQHAPVRVTLAAPSRGDLVRVEVDEGLLSLAVDRVAEHVAVRADREHAPPRPGRWCRHCHLLDVCDEGQGHLGAASVIPPGP